MAILFVTTWLLGACSSAVHLMPTPTLFTTGDSGAFAAAPLDAQSTEIEVFYATNRLPVGPADSRHYTRVRSDQLRLGVATLTIGDERTTLASLQAMSTSAASGRRPVLSLESTREMAVLDADGPSLAGDAQAFLSYLDEALKRSRNRELLIYV
nr:hypothetical protein [Pseudomonadales bacterium]